MPSVSEIEESLAAKIAQRFRQASQAAEEYSQERSDRKFEHNSLKKLLVKLKAPTSLAKSVQYSQTPAQTLREMTQGTCLEHLYVCNERLEFTTFAKNSYRSTETWKLFCQMAAQTPEPSILFNIPKCGLHILTRASLSKKAGVPRIEIPAAELFTNAYIVSIDVFADETNIFGKEEL